MSDSDLARRTAVEVTFDGVDITDSIKQYLLSITYTDNEEDETDDLQINLQDRDGVWLTKWLADAIDVAASNTPNSGFTISAVIVRKNWNNDGKDTVLDCGQFELDAVSAKGPPSVITIKGTSLPYGTGIRQIEKNKAWEAFYLSGIASEIAAAGGMACMYESSIDPYYARLEQVKTSDIAFLSQLCHDAGLSLKVTNSIIVLFDQAGYESKTPVFDIKRGDGKYTKWTLNTGSTDTKYTSCRVSYTNPATGRAIRGIAYSEDYKTKSKNNKQFEVTAKVSSIGEAEMLAAKKLRLINKYGLTAQFSFPGNPNLAAGLTVTLTGWGPWSGKYIISQAQHTAGNSGFTTQTKLRRVLEGY